MRLNQITVPSLDVDKAISFYEKIGLKLIVKSLPNYARFVCLDGQSTFSIHLVDKLPSGEGVWIYFECDDLNKTVKSLQEKDVVFETEPQDQPWLWKEARLKDLDGNQLILFHAGTNRIYPPWALKS